MPMWASALRLGKETLLRWLNKSLIYNLPLACWMFYHERLLEALRVQPSLNTTRLIGAYLF